MAERPVKVARGVDAAAVVGEAAVAIDLGI